MSSCSRIMPRDPVAGRAGAADVDHQPQRVVGVDAGPADDPLVEHVEAGHRRGSARAARSSEATVSASSSSPRIAAWRRAASSDAVRSAFGLVDSIRVTARSTIALVDPVAALADVQDRRLGERADDLVGRGETTSAPHSSAAVGQRATRSAGARPRPRRRPAARRGRGRPRRARRRRRPRRSRSARRSSPRPRRARRRAPRRATPGSGSGRSRARGRARARRSAAAARRGPARRSVEEWTLRCTTTRSPRWASARQIAWLPPEPPLTRNQLRRAPQASAASRWASWNGASAGIGPDVDPLDPGRDVEPQGAARRSPRAAPGRRPARPCGRGRGSARGRDRRRRSARRGRASRPAPRQAR